MTKKCNFSKNKKHKWHRVLLCDNCGETTKMKKRHKHIYDIRSGFCGCGKQFDPNEKN